MWCLLLFGVCMTAAEAAPLSSEERGLHVLHRLYGALDVASRRLDKPGRKSVRSIMRQSVPKVPSQPVQEGEAPKKRPRSSSALSASSSEQQQSALPEPDAVVTSTSLSRAEMYLRDAVLLPKGITTGLYESIPPPGGEGSLRCCDGGSAFTSSSPAGEKLPRAPTIVGGVGIDADADTDADSNPIAVRHAPHFMQIISQGMQPSVHVEHLQAVHNQLQSVVVALGGRLPWPFQPLPRGVR